MMRQMLGRSLLTVALIGACATPVAAFDPVLEDRVGRLERILENQSGSELLLQVQQLQTEVQELRGMLESQRLEHEKLKRQLRDQYLDIDSRLSGIGSGGAGGRFGASSTLSNAKPMLPSGVIDASGGGLDAAMDASGSQASLGRAPPEGGVVGIPSLPTPETLGGNERDAYAEAFGMLKERKYDEAMAAFNELLRRYPRGEFTDNARYWLAEIYYVKRNYSAALAEFERLVKLHPSSPKVPGAMLKIGFIQYDQKDFEQAKASLQRVISAYPSSTEARLARSRLERMDGGAP